MGIILTILFWISLPFFLKPILSSLLMPICILITLWLLFKWL